MIGLKNSYEIAYNGTENECRFELYADTAADLQGLTHFDGIKIQMGSECTDIATGDKYILNGSGAWILQPSDCAFSNVYTKAEIDAMIANYYTKTEADALFDWITFTITTDTLPLSFISDGTPLTPVTIKGNGSQTGTPTPDNPVMPDFVGVRTANILYIPDAAETTKNSDVPNEFEPFGYKIPISCAGQTTPVYLGQTQTVRRIKKLVLDGTESWGINSTKDNTVSFFLYNTKVGKLVGSFYSNIYPQSLPWAYAEKADTGLSWYAASSFGFKMEKTLIGGDTAEAFKSYLAAQYAAGTPVTVWYVLATPETAIVNEPLCKIGDYADELHIEDAAVTIPTVKGQNTLTVDTTLQPSEVSITGCIRRE